MSIKDGLMRSVRLFKRRQEYNPVAFNFEHIVREYASDPNSPLVGKGRFRASLMLPSLLGIDLKNMGIGDLNALGFYLDILIPFLIIILISFFTP